ncbi:ribulose-phosphate 3-epimerase, partial [Kingella kingae]|nr:ribulose-phosphate 3-epimerase [Kingella kingae]
GQAFIPHTLDKLRQTRQLLDAYQAQTGRRIALEVDGGIKTDNIAQAAQAGADTFVAGSAIFGAADYAQVIQQMRDELSKI